MASLDRPNFYTSYLNYGFVNTFSRGISKDYLIIVFHILLEKKILSYPQILRKAHIITMISYNKYSIIYIILKYNHNPN